MITLESLLPTWALQHQKVLLRADLNIPLVEKTVSYDHRLQAVLPTINMILNKGGTIILVTHLGRPQERDEKLSTKHLIPWFTKHDYSIEYAATLQEAHNKSSNAKETIILLENLRFFFGETAQEESFAQQLAHLGDFYVNDAFATEHRNHASLTITPTFFIQEKRSIGLLVEKELTMLNKLLNNPQKPFVLIIGGGKINDKLPVLKKLLDLVDTIMLCPATVFTFLKAQGKPVGKSLVDDNLLDMCKQILDDAEQKNIPILFPQDYVVAQNNFAGPLSTTIANNFPNNGVGISIGPRTLIEWAPFIHKAQTIFYAGLMGSLEKIDTLVNTQKLFTEMALSDGFSVIGGGDSVAAAQMVNIARDISFCSTGGGATLAYLAGDRLPGLEIFT